MHRIIFQFGPFTLYSYGLLVAGGFLLSTILILRDAGRFNIPADSVFDCLIAILIGGLIGGRLLFVLINWQYYSHHPLRVVMFHEGGLAFQGALGMAIPAVIVVARAKGIPLRKLGDLVAPYVPLGQAVGRIGCFLNGCCYGKTIERGIGIVFPGETVLRIPVQIYSSLVLLGIFGILVILREKRPFDGYVLVMYIILYSVFRFFMDFIRGDNLVTFYGIRLSQLISIMMLLCGIVAYTLLSNAERHGGVRCPHER